MSSLSDNTVFVLLHIRESPDGLWDYRKTIGVFTNKQEALDALRAVKAAPGFSECDGDYEVDEEGFGIAEYELDRDASWLEGFVHWSDA